MDTDFILFDDQIINKRDIIRIHKCESNNIVSHGIRLVIRCAGEAIEWYGDNQARRDEVFGNLIYKLC